MDDEARERIIVACTEAAMMMEEFSVRALGAAAMVPEGLGEFVRQLRSDLATILYLLEWN